MLVLTLDDDDATLDLAIAGFHGSGTYPVTYSDPQTSLLTLSSVEAWSTQVNAEAWQDVDRDLFERLRELRLEVARERGVPPYVIFHDTTLRDMARRRPRTVDELRLVYGVGERKAADLGARFVEAIVGAAERG